MRGTHTDYHLHLGPFLLAPEGGEAERHGSAERGALQLQIFEDLKKKYSDPGSAIGNHSDYNGSNWGSKIEQIAHTVRREAEI